MSLSLGGNTVTLSRSFAPGLPPEGNAIAAAKGLAAGIAARQGGEPPTLAVVHVFSTHNLLLRYWLAAGGIDPDRDVRLVVIPPAAVVEAMREKRIVGFCAGAPWGCVAERAGLGVTAATSHSIAVFVVPCESVLTPDKGPRDPDQHLYSWSPGALANLFRRADFDVVSCRPFIHRWPPQYARLQRALGWSLFHLVCRAWAMGSWRIMQVRIVARKPDP